MKFQYFVLFQNKFVQLAIFAFDQHTSAATFMDQKNKVRIAPQSVSNHLKKRGGEKDLVCSTFYWHRNICSIVWKVGAADTFCIIIQLINNCERPFFFLKSTHQVLIDHYTMRVWKNDDHLVFFERKLGWKFNMVDIMLFIHSIYVLCITLTVAHDKMRSKWGQNALSKCSHNLEIWMGNKTYFFLWAPTN